MGRGFRGSMSKRKRTTKGYDPTIEVLPGDPRLIPVWYGVQFHKSQPTPNSWQEWAGEGGLFDISRNTEVPSAGKRRRGQKEQNENRPSLSGVQTSRALQHAASSAKPLIRPSQSGSSPAVNPMAAGWLAVPAAGAVSAVSMAPRPAMPVESLVVPPHGSTVGTPHNIISGNKGGAKTASVASTMSTIPTFPMQQGAPNAGFMMALSAMAMMPAQGGFFLPLAAPSVSTVPARANSHTTAVSTSSAASAERDATHTVAIRRASALSTVDRVSEEFLREAAEKKLMFKRKARRVARQSRQRKQAYLNALEGHVAYLERALLVTRPGETIIAAAAVVVSESSDVGQLRHSVLKGHGTRRTLPTLRVGVGLGSFLTSASRPTHLNISTNREIEIMRLKYEESLTTGDRKVELKSSLDGIAESLSGTLAQNMGLALLSLKSVALTTQHGSGKSNECAIDDCSLDSLCHSCSELLCISDDASMRISEVPPANHANNELRFLLHDLHRSLGLSESQASRLSGLFQETASQHRGPLVSAFEATALMRSLSLLQVKVLMPETGSLPDLLSGIMNKKQITKLREINAQINIAWILPS